MSESLHRLAAVARKEVTQFYRDRVALVLMLLLPFAYLLGFGYAIRTDIRHIPTFVFDQDRSPASRELVEAMVATGFFDREGTVTSFQQTERILRRWQAKAVLTIPPRFEADFVAGRRTVVQLALDGTDPQTVGTAIGAASGVVRAWAADFVVDRGGEAGAGEVAVLEPMTWYNPDLRSQVFIVPALVGVVLTLTMVGTTAISLVREREAGMREHLIVTPVRGYELLIGKILPYVALGYVQMTIVMVVGWLAFGVAVAGSVPLIYALALPFVVANLGIGFVFSTLASTQLQVMQMTLAFVMPNILLSGFIWPVEAMPLPAQYFSELLPLHHFLRIVRGITLKSSELADLGPELWKLLAFVAFSLGIASLRLRKKQL